MLDAETRGLFASIGIQKGKEFAPDERMQRILADGVALGNAAARSIVWYPRYDKNMKGERLHCENIAAVGRYPASSADIPHTPWHNLDRHAFVGAINLNFVKAP